MSECSHVTTSCIVMQQQCSDGMLLHQCLDIQNQNNIHQQYPYKKHNVMCNCRLLCPSQSKEYRPFCLSGEGKTFGNLQYKVESTVVIIIHLYIIKWQPAVASANPK